MKLLVIRNRSTKFNNVFVNVGTTLTRNMPNSEKHLTEYINKSYGVHVPRTDN